MTATDWKGGYLRKSRILTGCWKFWWTRSCPKKEELIRMHERASPMVRYELSRISANIFVALGRRKEVSVSRRHEIQCSKVMVWTYVNGLALLKGAGHESIGGKLERSNSYPHAEAATNVIWGMTLLLLLGMALSVRIWARLFRYGGEDHS